MSSSKMPTLACSSARRKRLSLRRSSWCSRAFSMILARPPRQLLGEREILRPVAAARLREDELGDRHRRAQHHERHDHHRAGADPAHDLRHAAAAALLVGVDEQRLALEDGASVRRLRQRRRRHQQLLDQLRLRRIAMRHRAAATRSVLHDVDDAPVGQLRNHELGDRVQDALVLHRLGERADLREQLEPGLGRLARVDVAAGNHHAVDRAIGTVHGADVMLAPATAVGREADLRGDDLAGERAARIGVDRAHHGRRQPDLGGCLPVHLAIADELGNAQPRGPVGIDQPVLAILDHDALLEGVEDRAEAPALLAHHELGRGGEPLGEQP